MTVGRSQATNTHWAAVNELTKGVSESDLTPNTTFLRCISVHVAVPVSVEPVEPVVDCCCASSDTE